MRVILLLALLFAVPVFGQNIELINGTVVATKGVRRAGDTILATVDLQPAQPGAQAASGELGYPIAQIAKIDFPQPAMLQSAVQLINGGNPGEAIGQIQTVLAYYNTFGDVPGSWWADATLLEEEALLRMGSYDQAEALAQQMSHTAADPDNVRTANVYLAAATARQGQPEQALEICEQVLKEAKRPQTLAVAALNAGQCHLALGQWAPALLTLLQVPVFYPEQEVLMPDVLLGSGQAYIGLRDFPRATRSLNELISKYSLTPQAAQAKDELARATKLENSLQPLK